MARELERRGHSVVFVGTRRGVEMRLVPLAGYPLRLLRVGALNQVSWRRRLGTLTELPGAFWRAATILDQTRPGAVLSLGGYASGPVTLMAWMKQIPLVILEPNAAPGFAHRRIAPVAARALLGFEQAGRFFPEGRWEASGIPVREEFFRAPAREAGARRAPFTVLITGGSQGSRRLNRAAVESLPRWAAAGLLQDVIFVHQSGQNEYNEICFGYREAGARAEVEPFLDDMPGAMARADAVVCRAGASTAAELCAAGRASLLVPFPHAADQHQLRNARALEAAGAARVVEDAELTGQRLFEELSALRNEPARLERMEQAARRLAKPDAARRAADVLEQVARG